MNTVSIPTGRGFFTYVHRNEAGRALYVGSTINPLQRTANHVANKRKSHWFADVASIDWAECSDRGAMLAREADLIERLRPLHNLTWHPDQTDASRVNHYARRDRVNPKLALALFGVALAIEEWAKAA